MLACAVHLAAQSTSAPTVPAADLTVQAMTDAYTMRGELADFVTKGTLKAEDAISRLKSQSAITGLPVDRDTDFALGASDVGRRLVARKPELAVKFFAAAEQSLDAIVQRTSDASAKTKAQLLCQLALLRCNYLGNATQARKDIDQAIALQPEDRYLQQARGMMASSHAEQFRSVKEGGKP